VPVTAKLSQKLYDKLGEDVANELVDWFNAVDATYRADLRELNELNFARFDAKLEQRLAELDARWGARWTGLDAKLERRLAEFDARWSSRWTELDAKWGTRWAELDVNWGGRWTELDAKWSARWAELDAKLEQRLAAWDAKWERRNAELRTQMATGLADVKSGLKWMYAFWAPTALAVLGTGAGVISLLVRR